MLVFVPLSKVTLALKHLTYSIDKFAPTLCRIIFIRYNYNFGFIQPTKSFTRNAPEIIHLHHMFVPENETVFHRQSYLKEVGNGGLVVAKIACFVEICEVKDEVVNVVFVLVKVGCVVNSSSVTAEVDNVVFANSVVEKMS